MLIAIDDCGRVILPRGNVLGHKNENGLRVHRVIHPKFEGAYYDIVLDFGGTQRVIQISGGEIAPDGDMLSEVGEAEAQFRALKAEGGEVLVFKSDIFRVRILP
ncbi:MAG: hypothetical protein J5582_13810 [Ruminococcus sp.]|uniref:hypothetical protein n=1 Tax=Ruminococcus sp. TaxID=41978 RepID=UPI0025D91285|nr:hypothetical protein [Ruminococcus sp.]MBO4867613.1 hypothetical protein [Ruminococcus sp.]